MTDDGSAATATREADLGQPVLEAVEVCLAYAGTYLAWDGKPRLSDGNVWTPHKALRRVTDHLVDHIAEVQALLAGEETIPDSWHGRSVTLAADWAPFTEADLNEAHNRLRRLGQTLALLLRQAGPAEWDRSRGANWTLRRIAEHVSTSPGITAYVKHLGWLDPETTPPAFP